MLTVDSEVDLPCPDLSTSPWLSAEATFFNASGLVVATSSDSETSPVVGVRYPLRIFGGSGAVRAELLASISCIWCPGCACQLRASER
jgi:hypothetical protein